MVGTTIFKHRHLPPRYEKVSISRNATSVWYEISIVAISGLGSGRKKK